MLRSVRLWEKWRRLRNAVLAVVEWVNVVSMILGLHQKAQDSSCFGLSFHDSRTFQHSEGKQICNRSRRDITADSLTPQNYRFIQSNVTVGTAGWATDGKPASHGAAHLTLGVCSLHKLWVGCWSSEWGAQSSPCLLYLFQVLQDFIFPVQHRICGMDSAPTFEKKKRLVGCTWYE